VVSDSSSSSSSYTDDMVFGAFAQWTRRCLHVVTSFVGQLRRRRYVPTTDMNGMPVLPMIDNAHGYCLLICSADGSLGEYGYRAVGFNSLLETVRRDIERDERNRKRKRNRKPCTCASRMLNCEDADSCECRQLGGKKVSLDATETIIDRVTMLLRITRKNGRSMKDSSQFSIHQRFLHSSTCQEGK
jgi:hypothetical protein